MTKNIRIPVVAFLLLCCNLISYAQETEHAKLDRYLRLLGDKNKFMGSVSVFSKGTEIYARSVGFADIDKQIVADAQSEYHIGSISKLFTTVMIFQAIEAGQLSLSSPIDSYFPIIKNAHKITIGHLLSHRSGIHNFTADEQYLNWNTQAKTKEQMVEIIARGGSDFVKRNIAIPTLYYYRISSNRSIKNRMLKSSPIGSPDLYRLSIPI